MHLIPRDLTLVFVARTLPLRNGENSIDHSRDICVAVHDTASGKGGHLNVAGVFKDAKILSRTMLHYARNNKSLGTCVPRMQKVFNSRGYFPSHFRHNAAR